MLVNVLPMSPTNQKKALNFVKLCGTQSNRPTPAQLSRILSKKRKATDMAEGGAVICKKKDGKGISVSFADSGAADSHKVVNMQTVPVITSVDEKQMKRTTKKRNPRGQSHLSRRFSLRLKEAAEKKIAFGVGLEKESTEMEVGLTVLADCLNNNIEVQDPTTMSDIDIGLEAKVPEGSMLEERGILDISELSFLQHNEKAVEVEYSRSSSECSLTKFVKNSTPIPNCFMNISSKRVNSVTLAVKNTLENMRWYTTTTNSSEPSTSKGQVQQNDEEKTRLIKLLSDSLAEELLSGKYPEFPRKVTPEGKGVFSFF